MASKKDKFKKAASDQLKRTSGGSESGGMSELVRNIEEDKKEESRAPAQPDKGAAEKSVEPDKAAVEKPVAPKSGKSEISSGSPEQPGKFPSEGDVFETAMVVEVDGGAGNNSLSGKEPSADDGPQVETTSRKTTTRADNSGKENTGSENTGKRTTNEPASRPTRAARDYSTRRAETIGMAKTRESIYNVSSDIRLEDYTDSQSEGGGFGGIAKIGAGLLILLLLAWGVQSLVGMFFAPEYVLAISSSPITDAGVAQASQATTVSPGHGGSVFVRFQWNEGELQTDLVRITAEKRIGGTFREVASKSRTLPETVTYIYFQNSFTPGQYRIQVTARNGDKLAEREIFIR